MKKLLMVAGAFQLLTFTASAVDQVIYRIRHRNDGFFARSMRPVNVHIGPPTVKSTFRNSFPGITEILEKK
jgi:hypothetical protein